MHQEQSGNFSSKKEDKYNQDEKKSDSFFEFPPFEKFEKDFSSMYEKLVNLFPQFLIKDCNPQAASVNNFLVFQLIWTLKYLVKMVILENNKDWVDKELPVYQRKFSEIKHNINLADPDSKLQLQTCIDGALISPEKALTETNGEFALRWAENIISAGGSIVREGSKIWRIEKAKLVLRQNSLKISANNTAAIINGSVAKTG